MRRRLLAAASAAVLTGMLALNPVAAHASSDLIKICNSSLSFTRITVNNWGSLPPGSSCTAYLLNGSNQVRVDTDPDGPSHSYIINPVGAPVGPCHTNSDNHNSDPPNYDTVYYRNFDHGNCTN